MDQNSIGEEPVQCKNLVCIVRGCFVAVLQRSQWQCMAGCMSQDNCRLNAIMCSLSDKFVLLTDHHIDHLLCLVSSLLLSLSSFLSNEHALLTYLRMCLLTSLLYSPLRTLASLITSTHSFLFTAFCCRLLTIIRLLNNEFFLIPT